LLIAGNGVAAAASGTATTPPPVSPSTTAGGASGSSIHIFLFKYCIVRPKGDLFNSQNSLLLGGTLRRAKARNVQKKPIAA
jgi:hypothetical protein